MSKPSERFIKLSKLYKKNLIATTEYEKEMPYVYEEAIERNFLLEKISSYYDIDSKIETVYGRYSNVLNYHSKEGKTLSLRLIKKTDEGLYEPEWQNMQHKNIMTILNRKWHGEEDVICYLSPYLPYSLKQIMNSEAFKYSKQSSMFLRIWLKDIASGLGYIHSKEFAHTNITASNILIEDIFVAKITDFHFLSTSKKATNSIGLKYSQRPPESFLNSDGTSFVECTKVDVWSLGILAVNIFTGMALEKKLPDNVNCWSKDVYPQIFKLLKKKKFNKLHRKYLKYPSANDSMKSARRFAAYCFHFDLMGRPAIKDLLGHDLMNKSGFMPEKDKVWQKKVHWRQLEKDIRLLTDYQGLYEDLPAVIDIEPPPYSENFKNSNIIKNPSKVILDSEGQNHNIEDISDMKKERIPEVQHSDTKENHPNCRSGDTEENALILEFNNAYEIEKILEPFQEDEYADINSEGDRFVELLVPLSQLRVDSTDIDYTEGTNLEKQPKKQEENREILNKENKTTSTSLKTGDKILSENHNENIEADLNNTPDDFQDEDHRLAELLTSLSKQKPQLKPEEIKFCSPETQRLNREKEIQKNSVSITDFHKEKKVGKSSSFWNYGVNFLNFLMDSNLSYSMLNPENYLFKLVKNL